MKSKTTQKEIKNVTTNTVIRVTEETRNKLNIIKEKVNLEDGINIKDDAVMNYLAGLITDNCIKELQLSTLTWSIEEPRLRILWSKKKGKISNEKWKELLYTGSLQSFIQDHSRIKF